MNTIRVLVYEPGVLPYKQNIALSELPSLVGGEPEKQEILSHELYMVFNRAYMKGQANKESRRCRTFLVVKCKNGQYSSLTDEDIQMARTIFVSYEKEAL